MKTVPGTKTSFFRYNVVAIIATSVDFFMFIFLTEVVLFWYLLSAVMGAISGGVTAFILERNWAFVKTDGKLSVQSTRYLLVWLTSIVLNITGLYIMVEFMRFQYVISKIVISLLVGIGFNFLTHKYFVFK